MADFSKKSLSLVLAILSIHYDNDSSQTSQVQAINIPKRSSLLQKIVQAPAVAPAAVPAAAPVAPAVPVQAAAQPAAPVVAAPAAAAPVPAAPAVPVAAPAVAPPAAVAPAGAVPAAAAAVPAAPAAPAAAAAPSGPPCTCVADDAAWIAPVSTRAPKCLFYDLGAGDGETFKAFLGQSTKWQFNYETNPFQKNQCDSYLLEANPGFKPALDAAATLVPEKVHPMPQQAIYMCDKPQEIFHIDVSGPGGWGSALDGTHASVKASTEAVPVQLLNLSRLLKENALPHDTVVVKMDIEGAEWDILPCLAQNQYISSLIDTLYLENHCPGGVPNVEGQWCPSTGQAGNDKAAWDSAIGKLQGWGVSMPHYWSPML